MPASPAASERDKELEDKINTLQRQVEELKLKVHDRERAGTQHNTATCSSSGPDTQPGKKAQSSTVTSNFQIDISKVSQTAQIQTLAGQPSMNGRMVLDQDAYFDSQYLVANYDNVNYNSRTHRDRLESNKDQSQI